MPSPSLALKNRKTDTGITNVRNKSSPHWRRWLGARGGCAVPFTSFCEYDKGTIHSANVTLASNKRQFEASGQSAFQQFATLAG
jgi:putative SOS response-associated peptidase YedK